MGVSSFHDALSWRAWTVLYFLCDWGGLVSFFLQRTRLTALHYCITLLHVRPTFSSIPHIVYHLMSGSSCAWCVPGDAIKESAGHIHKVQLMHYLFATVLDVWSGIFVRWFAVFLAFAAPGCSCSCLTDVFHPPHTRFLCPTPSGPARVHEGPHSCAGLETHVSRAGESATLAILVFVTGLGV